MGKFGLETFRFRVALAPLFFMERQNFSGPEKAGKD